MGKGISKSVGAHEPVSLSELIHQHVRVAIETAVHEELRAALGTTPYERSEVRRGYRNEGADANGTDGAGRADVAPRHPLQRRWREGMDVGDCPALSTANAGGQ